MAHMLHLGEKLTSEDVYELAAQPGEAGDKARAIWRSWARRWASRWPRW